MSHESRVSDPWDMLNDFCFHVYAQKSLSHSLSHTLSHSFNLSFTHSQHAEQLLFSCLCSKVTLSLSHSLILDMLNNFSFHLYAQKWLFIAENCNGFFDTTITLSCEFRGHWAGSQLKMSERQTKAGNREFSKVNVCHAVTYRMANAYVDPGDIRNIFYNFPAFVWRSDIFIVKPSVFGHGKLFWNNLTRPWTR